jgi:hypothetical protein
VAVPQGSKVYRIMDSTYLPGSAWVALRVQADDQF